MQQTEKALQFLQSLIQEQDDSSTQPEENGQWLTVIIMVVLTLVLIILIIIGLAIVLIMRSRTFKRRGYDLFNPKYELTK
ncbi:hypothetical protein KM1_158200 [Entamoeba histolytica HM-3:IMSS]|uniref:Uncharacterized protein n=1 Tax=Entamoeba histolytica HM-3:IMSS TaxID=885315 RepID=M7W1P8_ENTHI|nr:hypothetical protein KM1_158200 [Entamoeba histolytica HM-3:IMSS]